MKEKGLQLKKGVLVRERMLRAPRLVMGCRGHSDGWKRDCLMN